MRMAAREALRTPGIRRICHVWGGKRSQSENVSEHSYIYIYENVIVEIFMQRSFDSIDNGGPAEASNGDTRIILPRPFRSGITRERIELRQHIRVHTWLTVPLLNWSGTPSSAKIRPAGISLRVNIEVASVERSVEHSLCYC